VIDLLWGSLLFKGRDRPLLKERLMAALDKRVSINVTKFPPTYKRQADIPQKMPLPYFGGEVKTLEKSTLGTTIDCIIQHARQSNYSLRYRVEDEFRPWVAADPSWWPEIAASEIILVYMMPVSMQLSALLSVTPMTYMNKYITPVVDLLWGTSADPLQTAYIFRALESKGIYSVY
jgi:hypothetical protein